MRDPEARPDGIPETFWVCLASFALGLAMGGGLVSMLLPKGEAAGASSFRAAAPPPPPAPSPRGPRAGAGTQGPAASGDLAREGWKAHLSAQEARLRERLAVPRPGFDPRDAGRLYHARLVGVEREAVSPTGLRYTPYRAEALFAIHWYCDGKRIGPQSIRASYRLRSRRWELEEAVRIVGGEPVDDFAEKAWLRNLLGD